MRTLSLLMAAFAFLAAGIVSAPAQDRPHNDAVKDIIALSEHLDARDISQRARALVDKHDSCDISQTFRQRKYGGVGIGSIAAAPGANSIEALVRDWSGKKPPTAEQLKAHQMDLVRTARVLQAMAELAPHRMPAFRDEKKITTWKEVSRDFKVVTREFREGIEAFDAVRVRATSIKLQNACNGCHGVVF